MWFVFFLLACTSSETTAPPEQPTVGKEKVAEKVAENEPVDHSTFNASDVESCVSCHTDIVTEWKQSMHSRAHPDNDPVYAAMRTLRMKKQGEAIGAKCQKCHNPLAPTDPDSKAGKAGVACGACHDMKKLPDQIGNSTCLTCHNAGKNPAGAATCTTGPESNELKGVECVSCHLPNAKDGHPQHIFAGPHRAWYQSDDSMLKQAMEVHLNRKADTVTLSVNNTTGHAFPTGFPGRLGKIVLTDGVFSITPEQLVFKKVYVDKDGKPTMPPMAVKLAKDTRLKPGEERTVTLDVPKGTGKLRAELVFFLLPPPAAKALKLDGPETKPKRVILAEEKAK